MLSLHLIENFLRFQVQDKHNASSFSHMSLDGVTSIQLQNYKKAVIISTLWANYYGEGVRFIASFLDFDFFCLSATLMLP